MVASRRHLAPKGARVCDYGVSINVEDCEDAVESLATAAGKIPGRQIQLGRGGTCLDDSWGQVPSGCSAQSGEDWAAHYKVGTDTGPGCIHSAYQLVCQSEGKITIR